MRSGASAGAVLAAAHFIRPADVMAHPTAAVPGAVLGAWSFDPFVVVPLIVTAALYARGLRRLWRSAGTGRGIQRWQVWSFAAGMALLVVALISPMHALGGALFSVHMTQHIVLMTLAAPLLVWGAPVTAWTWALSPDGRRAVSRTLNARGLKSFWHWLKKPSVAWLVHALAIWVWHVPVLYSATITNEWVHTAQHAAFMGSAILFWWSLQLRAVHGAAVLYLFTTAVHSSLLGALLALSPSVYYAPYEVTAPLWGLTALEDQQMGGLIMWVPAGALYFAAALALLASWLRAAEQRTARRAGATLSVLALTALAGCGEERADASVWVPGGDSRRGQQAIVAYGCGACHEVRGIRGATGMTGPTLTGIADRVYVAGSLPNAPETLMRFIMSPTTYRNPTGMPELGVTPEDARDIVAYLYSIR